MSLFNRLAFWRSSTVEDQTPAQDTTDPEPSTGPDCPSCGRPIREQAPIAIRSEDIGRDYIETAEIVDGQLVMPGYYECHDCGEKVYYHGVDKLEIDFEDGDSA